jgi:hypothetical protein
MNSMVLLGIGMAILILYWAAGRRRSCEIVAWQEGAEGDQSRVRLPRPDLIRRCLSAHDIEFAGGVRAPAILQVLLQERRRLALKWLRSTRREAFRLVRLHLRTVRHAPDLRPVAEAKLMAQVCVFLIVCHVLLVMVWFYGPFRAQAFLQPVASMADMLCRLSGGIAETVRGSATSGLVTVID